MTQTTLREHLAAAPFTLAMSSGFFGFFAHAGMLRALEQAGLAPSRVGGASAGALVAGLWASGRSAEELGIELACLRREDFWDPGLGAGLLRGRLFRRKLEETLAVREFEQCRVPCFASVYDVVGRRVHVEESGALAPALVASCAVPGLFHPVVDRRRVLVDGGVADRPGLSGVLPGERTLFHHLASKSPWRGDESMRVPRRRGMVSLVIHRLPRLGPFRLADGPAAFERARDAAARALDAPVTEVVEV